MFYRRTSYGLPGAAPVTRFAEWEYPGPPSLAVSAAMAAGKLTTDSHGCIRHAPEVTLIHSGLCRPCPQQKY